MAKGKRRPIIRIDNDGNEKRYESIQEAADELYGESINIIRTAQGKTKNAYGFRWRYADE